MCHILSMNMNKQSLSVRLEIIVDKNTLQLLNLKQMIYITVINSLLFTVLFQKRNVQMYKMYKLEEDVILF